MENALLIGLSKQMALRRQMDVLANNMANVSTAGYRAESLRFEEHLMPGAEMPGQIGSSARLSYVMDAGIVRNFESGSLERTDGEFDVAISGRGWLVVQTPEGERYTRNGQMRLDSEGQLITASGAPVLSDGGPITIGPDETGFTIARDGTVSTSLGPKGRLRVVQFADEAVMKKEGAALFSAPVAPEPAEGVSVIQGMIEKSNVQPVRELSRMIETVRAYTSTSKLIERTHELRKDAIQRLGDTAA